MDGNPKRYNDLIEAYVPTQYSGIVRDPKGWAGGTLGPITNVTSLPSDIVDASPKRGRWGGPLHGTLVLKYRADGYPKRYIVLDPFYSSRSVPNDLT